MKAVENVDRLREAWQSIALRAPRLWLHGKYLSADLAVLWFALLCCRTNHFYVGLLSPPTQFVLFWLVVACTAIGPLWYGLQKEMAAPHAFVAFVALRRWVGEAWRQVSRFPESAREPMPGISKAEKTSLLFLLIKLIYLPMMIEFLIGNWNGLATHWQTFASAPSVTPVECFNTLIFPCLIDGIFSIECALYAFGYAIESPRYNNVVRSIEPTVFGWAVTLACYPPFNGFLNNYVLWYTSENPTFTSPWLTCVAKSAVLGCFAVYLWAALSLGTKCSNLTNRGIVKTGAFAWVRHPAYAAKNLAWWIALLPVLSLPAALSMIFWSGIYFLRAVTEERHLSANSDYINYSRQVRYRFIPWIW